MNEFIEYEIIGEISRDSQCVIYEGTDAVRKATGGIEGDIFMVGGSKHMLFIFNAIHGYVPFTIREISPFIEDGKRKLLYNIRIDKSWVNENPNWTSRILENKYRHVYFSDIFINEVSEREGLCNETNY